MKIKTAIRYLRISTDRQSNFSISGQDTQTRNYCERNSIEIVDTFTDEGYSAKNFDRPDLKRLNLFIKKHYRQIDYLVVNSFDRFSRESGEAMTAIKALQRSYGIKIISVSEGITFDMNEPGSFLFTGFMLLKGEGEIITNRSRINLGIHTAKKKEGRFLGTAPIGYKNARDQKNVPIIVIDEDKAAIVRFIYHSFLNHVPCIEIFKQAKQKGFTHTGSGSIQKILQNPTYAGLLKVKAFQEHPAEIVEAIHPAIIDKATWYQVQEKFVKAKRSPIHIISDAMPLRGVLLCHCSKPLTGAPSRGKGGKYWNYYKCQHSGHNNISATKAHAQLNEALNYLSIPPRLLIAIKNATENLLEESVKINKQQLKVLTAQHAQVQQDLVSVEKKYINDQMKFETYNRWYTELTTQRMALTAKIESLSITETEKYNLMHAELNKMGDMQSMYTAATTTQKQQLIRLVFDSRLYYQQQVYRTPYVLPVFSHNAMIMKEKKLLVIEQKRDSSNAIPGGGAEGNRTPVQTQSP